MKQNLICPTVIIGCGNRLAGKCHQTSSLIGSFINSFVFEIGFSLTTALFIMISQSVGHIHTPASSNVSGYYFIFSQMLRSSLTVIKQLEVLEQFSEDLAGPGRDFSRGVHICVAYIFIQSLIVLANGKVETSKEAKKQKKTTWIGLSFTNVDLLALLPNYSA